MSMLLKRQGKQLRKYHYAQFNALRYQRGSTLHYTHDLYALLITTHVVASIRELIVRIPET